MSGTVGMAFSELDFHRCLARPGTIIDAGANVGAFSRPFSTWEGTRLMAFEPFGPIFGMLQDILLREHGGVLPATTTLHMAALGEVPGSAMLRVPRDATGAIVHPLSSMARNFEGLAGVSFFEFEVPVLTVDGLGLTDLTAMKIDTEGFETEVLLGARETLARCRPIVSSECVECYREGATWYIPGFMRGLGYDGWFHHAGEFWPIKSLDRRTMQVAASHGEAVSDPYIATFLFLPRELPELRDRLSVFGRFRSG